MLRSFFWTSLCLISAAISSDSALSAADPAPVDFGRQIQPLLSENCFFCHGPDAKNRKADLRLDTFEGATSGMAVRPGDGQASELVARILSTDPEEQMPPPSSNRKLTEAQKQLLKRWIDEGAKYTRHWAFVAPVRPAVPATPAGARVLNPIDAFVVSRLVAEGLPQAAEADKGRLLRRVSLDLTGLPPTPEEVAAFVADPAADAYTRAVDRLLASPRYGERMVWEWLDAARYADTNGYQGDPTRAMWYWRDWAIDAFNQNLPYDQFTIQQLAGDLLPNPTRSQLIATGFHRNHMINGEGGRIVEESRVEYVQDRVETTGTVWMGLTLTCCRCHDHKYDPFTQKQYYQLAAYFNSIDETGGNDAGGLANPVYSFLTPAQEQQIAHIKIQEQEAEKERVALQTDLLTSQPAWEAKFSSSEAVKDPAWQILKPVEATSSQGATLKPLDDGSLLATEKSPEKDEYTLQIPFTVTPATTAAAGEQAPAQSKITALRLEALPDDSLKNHGPGRAAENGNFVLNEVTLQATGQPVELAFVSADFSQQGWEAAGAVDGKPETGWGVLPEFGKPHVLLLELLRKGNGDATLIEEARSVMVRQVGQMVRLVDDLLDVSRISHGKMQLRKRRVDLGEVLGSAIETSRPLIEAVGHELTVASPPVPIYLEADPVRLAQVFSNLLNNAARYTDANGRIRLSVERQGSDVLVSVKDNGIGIAAETLPRIFQMFAQATPALERSQSGLGIGLSLVKGVVELHGGRVEAHSNGPGNGSEFVVRLPIIVEKQVQETQSHGDNDVPLSVAKRRVLIVDDLKDNANSLAMLLKIMGHDVHTAYDGEDAIIEAEKFKPEVILLDIGMPKLNGYEACRRIREESWGKDIFLIALTGWGQEDDRRRTEEAGFNRHMVKPVDTRELMKVLVGLQATAE